MLAPLPVWRNFDRLQRAAGLTSDNIISSWEYRAMQSDERRGWVEWVRTQRARYLGWR